MKRSLGERRRFIRLEAPIGIAYTVSKSDRIFRAVSKNISAEGLRFQIAEKNLDESDTVQLTLESPKMPNPIHARGRVIWIQQLSIEDGAPFDVGISFEDIDEDNKNTFLKFLCDLIYSIPVRNAE